MSNIDYPTLARQIATLVGGSENVTSFTHCMTRLRLNVCAPGRVDTAGIKELDGVLGVIGGDQVQVVVGPGHADRLHAAFLEVYKDASCELADATAPKVDESSRVRAGFRHIGNIFIPVIPGFVAGGLIVSIAGTWKLIDPSIAGNGWFLVFAALGGIVISALNFIVGYTTALEFSGTPVLGVIAGGIPYMAALAGTGGGGSVPQSLTLPVVGPVGLGMGGILAVIITAWLFTVIEKRLRRGVPAAWELFVVPALTVILGGAAAVVVIMPVSALLLRGFTWVFVDFALQQGGAIGGFLMASLFLPTVLIGVHQGLLPLHAQLITDHGYTELLPIFAMAGAGQNGMAMAIWLKTRNKELRTRIRSALPLGLLGIGEPLTFGVSVPLVFPCITACLGAGFGGAFVAWGMQQDAPFGAQALGVSGLLLTGVITPGKWLWYLCGLGIATGMGFALTYCFGFQEKLVARLG